ncbi:MAG: hypothetical protein AAF447_05725 [Myxococcota bacterium]
MNTPFTPRTLGLSLSLLALAASPLSAQLAPGDDMLGEVCAPTFEAAPLRLLRQLSLDVRGRIPSIEEYQQLQSAADPDAEFARMRTAMFASPEFSRTTMEYHRGLLWTSFDRSLVSLEGGDRRIGRDRGRDIWFVNNRKARYRGNQAFLCDDVPHTSFDADGRPLPMRQFDDGRCTNSGRDGVCDIDGTVMVAPYWDPENPIKVCAFDANDVLTEPDGDACSFENGSRFCGCGPNLQHCIPGFSGNAAGDSYARALQAGFTEEPLRLIESIVSEGESYLETFRGASTYVNGPIAHYYRYNSGKNLGQAQTTTQVAYDVRIPNSSLAGLSATDTTTWRRIERGPEHAGVLTTPGYLVRFASDRARANRFYTAFYCDPFVPQSNGIPAEEENPPQNLRERDGCADCHQELEPAAAHWGRWRNGGSIGFFDPLDIAFREPYEPCNCDDRGNRINMGGRCSNNFCNAYFVTAANTNGEELELHRGRPLAALWLEEDDDRSDFENVEFGPAALVDTPNEVRRVAECAVRQLAEHLYGRTVDAGDFMWLAEQASAFDGDGDAENTDGAFDWKALYERLVIDPRYLGTR